MDQRPTNESFAILLRLRWRTPKRDDDIPTINELSWAIYESARQRLKFDPIIADILYQSYADIGHISEAKAILSLYKSVVTIFCDSKDYTNILRLERIYGIKSTMVHWSIVINNCIRSGNFMQAFGVYDQSKKAGIKPDAASIAPLLRALARLDKKGPSDQFINRALAIYRDLADTVPPSMRYPPSSKSNLNFRSTGPDIDIYNTIFRMLLASRSETDYLSVTDSLLKEMEDRHLPTNSSAVTASKIIVEMQRAVTYADAFDFYHKHQSNLDEHDYEALLQAYCRLSFRGDLEAARYADKVNATRAKVKDNQQTSYSHDQRDNAVNKKFEFFFTKYYFM